MTNLSIYVHIPFCEVKCGYCDFFSVPRGYGDASLQEQYVDELIREIDTRAAPYQGRNIHTLFFGGGTPSLLAPRLLKKIRCALEAYFNWSPETEWTMEANPKTVSLAALENFRGLGVNRLSMGVQSFDDRFLKVLGRIHSGDEAKKTIADAYQAGFNTVNFDLIMALPGQTFEDWQRDLETALSFQPRHLSAYHLTIESGTAFEGLYQKGKLILPPEEEGVRCLTWTRERLAQAGLEAYEISNFAEPGFECRHNQNYWQYGEYLGFGAGAASFSKKPFACRQTNVRDLKKYLAGEWVGFSETIDERTSIGEFCWLALRTRQGIEATRYQECFGRSVQEDFGGVFKVYEEKHWLEKIGSAWVLTPSGLLFADQISADFLK